MKYIYFFKSFNVLILFFCFISYPNKIDGSSFFHSNLIFNIYNDTITLNVKNYGATGDGITDDWIAIEKTVDELDKLGGGIVFFPEGVYLVKNAITLKSKIVYRGQSKYITVIKASNNSLDNVFGQGYPLSNHWKKARYVGGTIDRLKKPDFLTNYSENDAFDTGGMAGLGVTNVKIENLLIDGNKNYRTENNLNLRGNSLIPFMAGEIVISTTGAKAIISGVFGYNNGFSIEPRTVEGIFIIGDIVTGQESGATMVIKEKRADDAFQMLIRFDAVSHSVVKNCILKNSIFTALSIYNYSNNNCIDSNIFLDNNKKGTSYTWGWMNIFVEFDARKNVISNNVIYGGLGYSIFVQSTGGMNYDTHILNNKVFDPASDGIRVGNENSVSSIFNTKIIGNTVINANGIGAVGIRVIHYGEGLVSNIEISKNLVKDCVYGILLQGRVEYCAVTGNTVFQSKILDIGSTSILKGNKIFNNIYK